MPHVDIHEEDIEFESLTLVEGLPGVGLVGKIAVDHLVETFDMQHYASIYCDGLPQVGVYREDDTSIRPPVRVHADRDRDLLVLQSDVPVSPSEAPKFAVCLTDWITDHDITPVYLSGLPAGDETTAEEVYGIATGDGTTMLDEAGIGPPVESGLISGPTGALLHRAHKDGLTSVGLIVESDAQFPDPQAAKTLLTDGVTPISNVEVATHALVESAEEIRTARERLAQRMQQANDESTRAQPIRWFQ